MIRYRHVVLTDSVDNDDAVSITIQRGNVRWPIVIYGADKSTVSLTDQEGQALLRALQKHYPLDALANIQ